LQTGIITSLTGIAKWLRKPNDISWMLLASLPLNVMVLDLTLQSWMIGQKFSTPAKFAKTEVGILVSPP